MSDAQPKRVLVTGASGFTAHHAISALLSRGYQVRGTLRDVQRADGVRSAIDRELGTGKSASLDFAKANLLEDEGWADAMTGVDAVLHMASPIEITQPRDRDAFVPAARGGVRRVLEAASNSETVKKVVMTSSVAAVCEGRSDPGDRIYTENEWSDPDGPGISPYARSKTLAERAAWEFMETNAPDFALTTVLPGLILGPVADEDIGVSAELIRRLLTGDPPGLPRLGWSIVDVRDVADLHVAALESSVANGQRYIAVSDFLWMKNMAAALRENLPEHGQKVPKRAFPDFVLKIVGLFDPAVRDLIPELGRSVQCSAEKAKNDLGWMPRSAREATLATARSLIEVGAV